jgi:predicted enzyme related to lactoylglutathione lyase
MARLTGASRSRWTTPGATAESTIEPGGSVLVEPFDAEAVRIAVLADPQGAVFAVNHFESEGL